jgi:hypothetical protein
MQSGLNVARQKTRPLRGGNSNFPKLRYALLAGLFVSLCPKESDAVPVTVDSGLVQVASLSISPRYTVTLAGVTEVVLSVAGIGELASRIA